MEPINDVWPWNGKSRKSNIFPHLFSQTFPGLEDWNPVHTFPDYRHPTDQHFIISCSCVTNNRNKISCFDSCGLSKPGNLSAWRRPSVSTADPVITLLVVIIWFLKQDLIFKGTICFSLLRWISGWHTQLTVGLKELKTKSFTDFAQLLNKQLQQEEYDADF